VSRSIRFLPRLRGAWDRFWFAPSPPLNLGICRALFYGGILAVLVRYDVSGFGGVSDAFWNPIWWFRLLGLPKPSQEALQAIQWTWKLSLAAACVGVSTRLATAVSFLLGTYLMGLLYSFGGTSHRNGIVVFAMASLALSRCGDAFSLDRWWRARRGLAAPEPSGAYRWPVRFVWVAMSCVFFEAGISKLRHSGLAWVTSDTMTLLLVQANYPLVRQANPPWNDWGLWLARHRWLARGLAAESLALETLFPLALFSSRLRPILVLGALFMQLGITVVMGPNFDVFILTYLFWVPWDRVAGWIRDRLSSRSEAPAPRLAVR